MPSRYLIVAVFIPLLSACEKGPKVAEVSGVVTVKGRPAAMVVVQFAPESGDRNSGGTTGPDGRYRLGFTTQRWGALLGKHDVLLRIMSEEALAHLSVADRKTVQTTFQATVEPGKNIVDFELLPK